MNCERQKGYREKRNTMAKIGRERRIFHRASAKDVFGEDKGINLVQCLILKSYFTRKCNF